MSYYGDSRYRAKRDKYSRPSGYVEETTYADPRGGYSGRQMDLVRRHGDSDDSVVEEVTRDFPPGEHYSYGYPRRSRVTRTREGVRRARSVGGSDPYYDDGYYRRDDYRPRRSRRYDDRRDSRRSYYSSSSSSSPPRRRKSLTDKARDAIGGVLGAAAGHQATGRHRDRDYDSRSRSRGRHSSRRRGSYDSRSRSRHDRAKSEGRIAQAVKTAVVAGAAEAFRARKDPGEWTGAKGRRVLTAAVSAGGVDGFLDRDPNKHEGRHIIESVLAGLATNHLVNGSRSKSRSRGGSRGRSQSRGGGGGIKDLASAGVLAAAGKQIYDRVRSKSRGRGRSGSRSSRDSDSDSGRDHRGDGSKRRGSSVSRYLNKGLAALGLEDKDKDRDRGSGDDRRRGKARFSDESSSGSDDDDYRSSGKQRRRRDVRGSQRADNYSVAKVSRSRAMSTTSSQEGGGRNGSGGDKHSSSHHNSSSDSDLGDSDEDKRERKKMVRNEMLTAGLATVATVHAAHSVIKGIEGRKKRKEQLEEGKITPEEARKAKMKANLSDVASVGLAALGIKGAIGEWKEVHEKYREHHEFMKKYEERHNKRVQRRSHSTSGAGSGTGSRRALTQAPRYKDGNPYDNYRDYPSD